MFELSIVALVLLIGLGVLLLKRSRRKMAPSKPEVSSNLPEPSSKKSHRFRNAISSWIPLFNSHSKERMLWEEALITSDMGPRLTDQLVSQLEKSTEDPLTFLKSKLSTLISSAQKNDAPWIEKKPWVVFMVGVNGVGKTTSIVKLAHWFLKNRLNVGVVGADTFRKAAIEQLQRGCERVGAEFFSIEGSQSTEGADPSAVIFDGLKKFASKDVILIDTSGRLHSKKNLMEELKKMKRVADKAMPGAPHDIWMVVDSTLGQNAVAQGKSFHEAVGLTGLVLTKMDGLSRGGTIFQLYNELQVPIRFLGVGEGENDLETFDFRSFIEDLFDQGTATS